MAHYGLEYSGLMSRIVIGTTLLVALAAANPVLAQQPDESAVANEDLGEQEVPTRPMFELGTFKIHDLRPTRNETAKINFEMHLAFSTQLTRQQVKQLDHWKHRLRDQVIIAIRTLDVKELQEPDLARLRRRVIIRINRLFGAKLAEEVLLTKYMFRTN